MNITCKENLTLTGIIGLTLLSGLALTLPSASADTDIVDDVAIEVPAACALTSTLNNNHEKEVNNGVYEPNIGKTTLKVTCNDSGGFSIYVIGFTGDTYTGEDHTKLIGANTGSKISTKVYASSDTASNWSMKLTPVSGSTISIENSFDDYHVVPDTFTKVATINSGTTPTTGASVETTYSAFMSGTQPADTYTGKVKYTMVHPSTNDTNSFVVNFFANGGTGTMSSQRISRGVATALSANSFTAPDGLRFAGWNTKLDGSGTTYTNLASVTNLADAGESVSLYAMWQEEKTIANSTTMQEVTSCPDTIPLETVYTLTDPRDNQTYKVARLKDGKCWMVENLNLAGGTTLSADDTDVTSEYISTFSTSNNLTKEGNTIKLPASDTAGFNRNNYSFVYNSGNKSTTCTSPGCHSYYSWDAATLGSGRTIDTYNTDAPYSICPKGWKLPTSRGTSATNWQTTSDFYQLAHQYGLDSTSTSLSNDHFYKQAGPGTTPGFLLAGYYDVGSFNSGGSLGYYWSSTSDSGTSRACNLYFYNRSVSSANTYSRADGFSVRCLYGS